MKGRAVAAAGDRPSICHINLERGFRGGERQTELLVRALSQKAWSQQLVGHCRGQLLERAADIPGLELRPCSGLLSAYRALGSPDLIHVHQGRAIHAAALCKLLRGVPYIVTRRVPNAPSSGLLTRRAYRQASKVVAISEAVARVMNDSLEIPLAELLVIADGFQSLPTDPERVAALRQQWGGDFVVGHVGALDHSCKGQSDLISVARRLAQSHPGMRFVMVGSGHDEARFRRESEGLHNVRFAGFQRRVGDYLGAFDLFAFPSLKEGMGSSLLDAMDHGLAVVASNVGGIPELVKDRQTGLLVPPANAEALGEAILALYGNPELRRAMGLAGKQRSLLFTAEVMAERYVELYREVLA